MRVSVREDSTQPGGYAIIEIAGGGHDGRFQISREGYAENQLGPNGWQVPEAVLAADRIDVAGDLARLFVGPAVVDRIELGTSVTVKCGGDVAALVWPDITPSFAGGARGRGVGATAAKPKPPASSAPLKAEPAPPPPSLVAVKDGPPIVVDPAGGDRRKALLIGGVAVLIVLVGAGAAWQLLKPAPAAMPAAPQAASPILGPIPTQRTPAQIVAEAKTLEEIVAAAKSYRERGDWNNALPLYVAAAERGSGPARTVLGKLYDPNGFEPNQPFSKPNPRQAAKYYTEAEQADEVDARPLRAALKAWLEAKATDGDEEAKLTLKDYWK